MKTTQLASALFVLCATVAPAFADVPDQQATCDQGFINLGLGQPLGQSFKPAQDELLSVDLVLTRASDSGGSGDITITVRENDFSGTIIGTVTESVVTTYTAQTFSFEFASPLTLVPEATYLLEIVTGTNVIGIGVAGCGYDRGRAFASYSVSETSDFLFATYGPCGNGQLDGDEVCDDGVFAGPCCDFPTCQYASTDTECSFDSNECTDDQCNGAGACTADNSTVGTACTQDSEPCMVEACNGAGACVSSSNAPVGTPCSFDTDLCTTDACNGAGSCNSLLEPDASCSEAPKSSLTIIDSDQPGKDKVKFKWKGGAFNFSELGDPMHVTDYAVCIYDDTTVPVAFNVAPHMERWAFDNEKFILSYKDKKGTSGPLTSLSLDVDEDLTSAKLGFTVSGPMASVDISTLQSPVVVQVRNEAAGCFGATYETDEVKKNTGEKFVAKQK